MTAADILILDLPTLHAGAVIDITGGTRWTSGDSTSRIADAAAVIVSGQKPPQDVRDELVSELLADPLERRLAGGRPVLISGTAMDILIATRSENAATKDQPESSEPTFDETDTDDDPALTQWVVAEQSTTTTIPSTVTAADNSHKLFSPLAGLTGEIQTPRALTAWSFDAHPLFTPPKVLWCDNHKYVLAIHNGPLTATCLDPRTAAGNALVRAWAQQH